MIEIHTDKKQNFKFGLNIENNQDVPKLRFVITFDDKALMFNAFSNDGKAEVSIPKLNEILKRVPEIGRASLEAVVDGAIFTPWEDEVEFKNSVRVSANLDKEEVEDEDEEEDNTNDDNNNIFSTPKNEFKKASPITVKATIEESVVEKKSDLRKFLDKKLSKK
jgi:hypothetical protein